jgi:hypothetical protein
MEAILSSETSVDTQWSTPRYIPEDGTHRDLFASEWGSLANSSEHGNKTSGSIKD